MQRLYLDCDGVLADFDAHFEAHFNTPPSAYEDANGSDVFWRDIYAELPTFYRDLPLMPDAMELFNTVSDLRPIILTGCPKGGWSEPQKIAWAREHFPGIPMITCQSRDKRDYCKAGDIIVDDRPHYKGLWEESDGIWITHTDAQNSIADLRALGIIK